MLPLSYFFGVALCGAIVFPLVGLAYRDRPATVLEVALLGLALLLAITYPIWGQLS